MINSIAITVRWSTPFQHPLSIISSAPSPRPSAFSEVQLSDTNQSAIDNCNRRGVGPSWAINGRFLSQRMTGVQRYASEIVAALDDLLVQNRDAAAGVAMRLVVPP